jgi:hypothetical protein
MKKLLVILSLIATFTQHSQAKEMEPGDMYEHMMETLEGAWKLSDADKQIGTTSYKSKLLIDLIGTDATALSYKNIGFNTTFQEDLLPNTKKQMVTMYHCNDSVDCTELLATHYCTKMNQPEFILDAKNSTKDKIIFSCDMRTALCQSTEDHVHQMIFEFSNERKHLKASYLGWTDQKPNKKNSIYHFDKK